MELFGDYCLLQMTDIDDIINITNIYAFYIYFNTNLITNRQIYDFSYQIKIIFNLFRLRFHLTKRTKTLTKEKDWKSDRQRPALSHSTSCHIIRQVTQITRISDKWFSEHLLDPRHESRLSSRRLGPRVCNRIPILRTIRPQESCNSLIELWSDCKNN